jgi:prolipoprotein diacylglyceryl transferase
MLDTLFNFITWNTSPAIFEILGREIRWYGVLFALAFVFGYQVIKYIYKTEGINPAECDRIAMFMVAGVVLGARLGHVFFYEPAYYLANPIKILYIWEGGLASHGASIGVMIAIWLYIKNEPFKSKGYLWMLDRIILTIPMGGAFIRLGNLFNSEIYGHQTDLPWGFIFTLDPSSGNVPRHPTQIYEALGYILIFFICFSIYKRKNIHLAKGYLFGIFLMLLFGFRFFIEYFKENQVDFENHLPLNMGQLLSIPFVLLGLFLFIRSLNAEKKAIQS